MAPEVLARGALMLVDAVRNLHALGVPLPAALDAASGVPARLVGRADLGTRRPGAVADVVVLDEALTVRETFVAGHPAYVPDLLFIAATGAATARI